MLMAVVCGRLVVLNGRYMSSPLCGGRIRVICPIASLLFCYTARERVACWMCQNGGSGTIGQGIWRPARHVRVIGGSSKSPHLILNHPFVALRECFRWPPILSLL